MFALFLLIFIEITEIRRLIPIYIKMTMAIPVHPTAISSKFKSARFSPVALVITLSMHHIQYLINSIMLYLPKSFIIAPKSPLKNLVIPTFIVGMLHAAEAISAIVIICVVFL